MAEQPTVTTPRLKFQEVLEAIPGVKQAYFQPPEDGKMEYPCIKYKRDQIVGKSADNKLYASHTRYQVTVIDRDPDSTIPQAVSELPMCTHIRQFAVEGLNHDVFTIYY